MEICVISVHWRSLHHRGAFQHRSAIISDPIVPFVQAIDQISLWCSLAHSQVQATKIIQDTRNVSEAIFGLLNCAFNKRLLQPQGLRKSACLPQDTWKALSRELWPWLT